MEAGTINPTAYAEQLLAQMGTSISLVPETVLEEVKRKKSKTGVNEVIIPWFTAHKQSKTVQSTLDDAAKILLKNMGTRAQTQRAESLRADIATYTRYIDGKFNDIKSYAKRIYDSRLELDTLLGKPSDGVLGFVESILAKGWYTLDMVKTEAENSRASEMNKSVWFKTPLVYMSHYKAETNEKILVKMQPYYVQFRPSDASVRVFGTEALSVDDHCHPHVGASGDVCWGNGAGAMQQTIKSGDPGPALEALKVILTTYNDESPYVRIHKFMELSGMDLSQLPLTYRVYESQNGDNDRILISNLDVPVGCQRALSAIDEIHEDSDLNNDYDLGDYTVVRPFIRVREGTNTRVDTNYYFKVITNGSTTYLPINEDLILEWVY